jgi:hypothetical protein
MEMRRTAISALFVLIGVAMADPQGEPCQATLTDLKPQATCAISAALIARPPRLAEIPVTKIENPSGQSFSIYVFVAAGKAGPELIGNVTVFPPDRTGVFVMRSQPAFERLGAARASPRITIEIRRTSKSQPWRTLSVSIGPLRWLYEEPK